MPAGPLGVYWPQLGVFWTLSNQIYGLRGGPYRSPWSPYRVRLSSIQSPSECIHGPSESLWSETWVKELRSRQSINTHLSQRPVGGRAEGNWIIIYL